MITAAAPAGAHHSGLVFSLMLCTSRARSRTPPCAARRRPPRPRGTSASSCTHIQARIYGMAAPPAPITAPPAALEAAAIML